MNSPSRFLIGIGLLVLIVAVAIVARHGKDGHDQMAEHDAEVVTLVENAVAAYQEQGSDVFAEMNDVQNQDWVIDDDLYVFALDLTKNALVVYPVMPTTIGVDLNDATIPAELRALAHYIRELALTMPEGKWVHYAHTNPLEDKDHKPRMSVKRAYVVISDAILFGAGRYMKRGH